MLFEKSKLYKNKLFNSLLILICLILIFIGKLDLIALRNLSSFLTDNNTVEGFYEGEITFTLTDNTTMSVFELIDFKVREDF